MQQYTHKLGLGKPTFLNDVEPWPEPVTTSSLLDRQVEIFSTYASLPTHAPQASGLWVMHCWVHDAFPISPRLVLSSPEKRCGKTTVLAVIRGLIPRPLSTDNITGPALFRLIEKWKPTILIDEADTFLLGKKDLHGLLNSGYRMDSVGVFRCEGKDHDIRQYSTWAPVAIALIRDLPDTLADRAIVISMRRKRTEEKLARYRDDHPEFEKFRRMAARWAADALEKIATIDPPVPESLDDRAADNWRPLLAIADLAGGNWPKMARDAAVALSETRDSQLIGSRLLAAIKTIFEKSRLDRVSSQAIVAKLVADEEGPWAEYRRGKPLTVRDLAKLLRPFGIMPRTIRLADEDTPKGYRREDFDEAFSRYL